MSDKIEFNAPKGLDIGESAKEGETVELMATFRVKGGKLCLTKIEDTPMPGYEDAKDENEPKDKPEETPDFEQSYAQAMTPNAAAA